MIINFKEKVEVLLRERKLTLQQLVDAISMSRQNIYYCFEKGSLETKYLEEICKYLQVAPNYFFQDIPDIPSTFETTVLKDKIIELEQLLMQEKAANAMLLEQVKDLRMIRDFMSNMPDLSKKQEKA